MHRSLEGHTAHRYDGELNSLHLQMLEMGGLVMDQVNLALQSLHDRSATLAQNVVERVKSPRFTSLQATTLLLSSQKGRPSPVTCV